MAIDLVRSVKVALSFECMPAMQHLANQGEIAVARNRSAEALSFRMLAAILELTVDGPVISSHTIS